MANDTRYLVYSDDPDAFDAAARAHGFEKVGHGEYIVVGDEALSAAAGLARGFGVKAYARDLATNKVIDL